MVRRFALTAWAEEGGSGEGGLSRNRRGDSEREPTRGLFEKYPSKRGPFRNIRIAIRSRGLPAKFPVRRHGSRRGRGAAGSAAKHPVLAHAKFMGQAAVTGLTRRPQQPPPYPPQFGSGRRQQRKTPSPKLARLAPLAVAPRKPAAHSRCLTFSPSLNLFIQSDFTVSRCVSCGG
ncbi:hypothetical protein PAHAL_2G012700 [Panicum hallii]|uniref:Uncharacterized protein n=1 Tax=Panicum hallii TaxID=206008 RepID=A0A2S3GV87_9POAL|nr:uncharacterized protein LOC112882441 isoform X1 [Panicum hallii]PAN09312.1 hypothetical protein PAHAL_2G012700 [Panicum hallii]PAN09313.1 hypothetical protein PAHAL_2G012700 [Panicum hallii]